MRSLQIPRRPLTLLLILALGGTLACSLPDVLQPRPVPDQPPGAPPPQEPGEPPPGEPPGSPGEPPPGEPPPGEPPPGEPPAGEPGGPPPGAAPPGSGGVSHPPTCLPESECAWQFDLNAFSLTGYQLTSIHPGVLLKIRNEGPTDVPKGLMLIVSCEAQGTSWDGASMGHDYQTSVDTSETPALNVGAVMEFHPGLSLDVVQYQYQVTCHVAVDGLGANDINPSNDTVITTIPPP